MTDHTLIPAFGLYGEQTELPDVVHCESFSARAPLYDWHILPHRHQHMAQLFVISAGSVKATADGQEWNLSDGAYLFVPELCVHALDFVAGTSGAVFSFPVGVMKFPATSGSAIQDLLARPLSGVMSQALTNLTETLQETAVGTSPLRPHVAVALINSTLALVAEQHVATQGPQAPAGGRIAALDALIASHGSQGWTASDFAAELSMSRGHLSRLCRHSAGMGATAYIERRKIVEACRLLAFTQLPVSEIGYRLGYLDPSYFSKRFSRVQGQSPSVYRATFMS